jgi:hypothetical protein
MELNNTKTAESSGDGDGGISQFQYNADHGSWLFPSLHGHITYYSYLYKNNDVKAEWLF